MLLHYSEVSKLLKGFQSLLLLLHITFVHFVLLNHLSLLLGDYILLTRDLIVFFLILLIQFLTLLLIIVSLLLLCLHGLMELAKILSPLFGHELVGFFHPLLSSLVVKFISLVVFVKYIELFLLIFFVYFELDLVSNIV